MELRVPYFYYFFWTIFYKMDHSAIWLLTGGQFCFWFSLTLHKLGSLCKISRQSAQTSDQTSNKPYGRSQISCEQFFWTIFYKMDHSALWLLTGGQFCSILLLVLAHSTQSRPTLQNQSPNELSKVCQNILWFQVPILTGVFWTIFNKNGPQCIMAAHRQSILPKSARPLYTK